VLLDRLREGPFTGYIPFGGSSVLNRTDGRPRVQAVQGGTVETKKLLTDYAEALRRF